MKNARKLWALALGLGWACAAVAAPAGVSVCDLGAVGDGEQDDTAAFEKALALGRETGQAVQVPRGTYKITRPLELEDQLLIGQTAGGWPADSAPMPTLLIKQVAGPALTLGNFASVHGLAITYPVQTKFPEQNAPPAIQLAGAQPTITSMQLQYPYDGIATAPNATPGRARLADIFIVSPKHDGVYLTRSYDVAQFRNIEVWCNVAMCKGAGFRFGRNDDGAFSDLFAFNCQTGFVFETDEGQGGGRFYGSMTNCSTDGCSVGYHVHGNHMINIAASDIINLKTSLRIDGGLASVRITGCVLQTNAAPAVSVRDCASLSITGSRFQRAFDVEDHRFVEIDHCDSLTLTGCQFSRHSAGVLLGEGVERAVVAHNIFEALAPAIVQDPPIQDGRILEPNVTPH